MLCYTIIAELYNYMVLTMKSLQKYVLKRKDVVSVPVPDTGDIENIDMCGFHQVLFCGVHLTVDCTRGA